MIQKQKSRTARSAPRAGARGRLYSIHALLSGQEFIGTIESPPRNHDFRFTPAEGRLKNGMLEINGSFSVMGDDGRAHSSNGVTATLAAMQGGLGTGPSPPEDFASRNKAVNPLDPTFPVTESTDSLGFVAALFFRLSPLDGRTLGLGFDLSRVQLNLRLAPVSGPERDMQWLFSALTAALLGKVRDEVVAQQYLDAINRLLKA